MRNSRAGSALLNGKRERAKRGSRGALADDDGDMVDAEEFEELARRVRAGAVWPDPYVNQLITQARRARDEVARLRAENAAAVGLLAGHQATIDRLKCEKTAITGLDADEWLSIKTLTTQRDALAARLSALGGGDQDGGDR